MARKYRLKAPATLLVVAIIVVICLGIGFHGAIHRQLNRWKLLPQPEKLTELYFTKPNSLPSTYTPGQTLAVNFTTHNLEYKTVDYDYRIIEISQDSNQSKVLSSGSFNLQQNKYHNQTVNITTEDMDKHVKLEVELVNVHESIDILLEREGS